MTSENDFTTLDNLSTTTPLITQHYPFGYCLHTIHNIQGTYTCIECGLETSWSVESSMTGNCMQKIYNPAERFRDLLDSYCYKSLFIPDRLIIQMQHEQLTTKSSIRKWLAKNSPAHADYSVEAYFRTNNQPVLQIDPYTKQTLIIEFTRFLDFYRRHISKSAPNLSFCLAILLQKYGIDYAEDSISVPVSSLERNNEMWTKYKIFQHTK